jgi:hypothetical protein
MFINSLFAGQSLGRATNSHGTPRHELEKIERIQMNDCIFRSAFDMAGCQTESSRGSFLSDQREFPLHARPAATWKCPVRTKARA